MAQDDGLDQGGGEKLKRSSSIQDLMTGGSPGFGAPITSHDAWLAFLYGHPELRRWYLSRVVDGAQGVSAIDLYYAPPTPAGEAALGPLSVAEILQLPQEDIQWWEDEDFDTPVHLDLQAFRQVLKETSGYPDNQPLEEGMVFLEKWTGEILAFIPFSYQAREASKEIYKQLLGITDSEPPEQAE